MSRYTIIKILLIFPSLFLLSLVVFFLSKLAPGDPVQSMIQLRGEFAGEINQREMPEQYRKVSRELGLDLPLFYFSLQPIAFPDTLHKIMPREKKDQLVKWLEQCGNWSLVQEFSTQRNELEHLLVSENSPMNSKANELIAQLKFLDHTDQLEDVFTLVRTFRDSLSIYASFYGLPITNTAQKLAATSQAMLSAKPGMVQSFPTLRFHGTSNQYHQWFSKVLRLDFGQSLVDARPAATKISEAFPWTIIYVLIAYVLSLSLAIPLGLVTAWYYTGWIEKLISSMSFIFYALPLFWLATLAVVFLTNDLYAAWLHWFPAAGLGPVTPNMGWMERIILAIPHLILPALILALHSAAGGIRIVRNSAVAELKSDYFLTAKAKGLSGKRIVMRHIFPNAMLPIITSLVSSFPAALAGSVVLEVVFNIPGIGRLLFDSIHSMDWNVVFAIMLLMGLITFIFYLIGDLLYAWLDPKIKFD